jgi:NitT/TauT family transport system substrate-binding protein
LFVLLGTALLLASAACGGGGSNGSGSGAGTEPKKVKLIYYNGVDVSIVPWVGSQLKLWQKHGIDLQLVPASTGPAATSALLSGDLDLISNQVPAMVELRDQGKDITALAGVYTDYPFSMVGSTSFQSANIGKFPEVLQDLKGKTFGVDAIGGVTYTVMRVLLSRAGLNPDKDVKFVAIGQTAQLSQALTQGRIDAFFALPTDVKRLVDVNKTAKVLLEVGTQGPPDFRPWQLVTIQGLKSRLDKDPQTFKNFQAAWADIAKYMMDPANSAKVVPVAAKFLNLDEANTKDLLQKVLPLMAGPVDSGGMENVIKFLSTNNLIKSKPSGSDLVWKAP